MNRGMTTSRPLVQPKNRTNETGNTYDKGEYNTYNTRPYKLTWKRARIKSHWKVHSFAH